MKEYVTPNMNIFRFRNTVKMTTVSVPGDREWVEALQSMDNKQKVSLAELGQLIEFNN